MLSGSITLSAIHLEAWLLDSLHTRGAIRQDGCTTPWVCGCGMIRRSPNTPAPRIDVALAYGSAEKRSKA